MYINLKKLTISGWWWHDINTRYINLLAIAENEINTFRRVMLLFIN